VDEGILQVAKYKDPDPKSHFYRKRALEVETAQILDQILPDFKVALERSKTGGDESYESVVSKTMAKNLNPFKRKTDKPVVFWSGLVTADGTPREYKYTVPAQFNGRMRVLALAVTDKRLGLARTDLTSRAPIIIAPNNPNFVSPGDEFEFTAIVTNNMPGTGDAKIDVKLETTEHFSVTTPADVSLTVGEGREQLARFTVLVNDVVGPAELRVHASTSTKKVSHVSGVSVRPHGPLRTSVEAAVAKGDNFEIKLSREVYPHLHASKLTVSMFPVALANGFTQYLTAYPYGCTEQLTSAAFPAMVLGSWPELKLDMPVVEANFKNAINTLRLRQRDDGAFGYYAPSSPPSKFQNAYAAHYLTIASEKGRPVPKELKDGVLKYLESWAGKSGREDSGYGYSSDHQTEAYAIYVLTLNGRITTSQLASLAERLKGSSDYWRRDLTALYMAASYSMLKMNDKATELVAASGKLKETKSYLDRGWMYYDDLVDRSQRIYLMARHFPKYLTGNLASDVEVFIRYLKDGGYNSLSSAYAILALDTLANFSKDKASTPELLVTAKVGGKDVPLKLVAGRAASALIPHGATSVKIDKMGGKTFFVQLTQTGFDKKLPAEKSEERLSIKREFFNQEGQAVEKVKLGERVEVRLTLKAVASMLQGLAFVDLLPGGFDIVLEPQERENKSEETPNESYSEGYGDGYEGEGYEGDYHEGEGEGEGEGVAETRIAPSYDVDFSTAANPSFMLKSSSFKPDYGEAREDRLILFGSLRPMSVSFSYFIQAVNKGKFTVPPFYGEGMYDRRVNAHTLGGKIEIGE
ncbi:MAG TPA: alpha-2-macroglobulin family protein, partial [Bdellovibrionales bacterium]|nr:alpha-2-macroglobulin family protein [Bdellovibrionales bacterium]